MDKKRNNFKRRLRVLNEEVNPVKNNKAKLFMISPEYKKYKT